MGGHGQAENLGGYGLTERQAGPDILLGGFEIDWSHGSRMQSWHLHVLSIERY
jgi:hypothetical protein